MPKVLTRSRVGNPAHWRFKEGLMNSEANERIKVLVEAANNVVRFIDNDSFDTSGWREAVDKLKAELAEVK